MSTQNLRATGIIITRIIIITIIIVIIFIIISIISSCKCCFDTIICQAFNLKSETDEGLGYVPLFIDVMF